MPLVPTYTTVVGEDGSLAANNLRSTSLDFDLHYGGKWTITEQRSLQRLHSSSLPFLSTCLSLSELGSEFESTHCVRSLFASRRSMHEIIIIVIYAHAQYAIVFF